MIEQSFNINTYHWFWYLVGLFLAPRITIMVFLTIYFKNTLPAWFLIWAWIVAILGNCVSYVYRNRRDI